MKYETQLIVELTYRNMTMRHFTVSDKTTFKMTNLFSNRNSFNTNKNSIHTDLMGFYYMS